MLDAAAARGYPIKVVLFVNDGDTGGDPAPLEDPQGYIPTVTDQLESITPLQAPVLIVTPDKFALGGRQPRGGALTPITAPFAAKLERRLRAARKAEGTALARAAIVAIRRLAAAGGHPLPKHIPPAKDNLNGILSSKPPGNAVGGPWLIVGLALGSLLLAAFLVGVHRRLMRQQGAAQSGSTT